MGFTIDYVSIKLCGKSAYTADIPKDDTKGGLCHPGMSRKIN